MLVKESVATSHTHSCRRVECHYALIIVRVDVCYILAVLDVVSAMVYNLLCPLLVETQGDYAKQFYMQQAEY